MKMPTLAWKIMAAMIGSILAAILFTMALVGADSVQPRPAVDSSTPPSRAR
jgi:Na+-transporting NADH:ubiquinone oxidoreductase subunit NqrB